MRFSQLTRHKIGKKSLLISTIFSAMIFPIYSYAEQPSAQIQSSPIQKQNSTIILKKLDYKTVFIQFYQKDIRYLKMKNIDMDQAVGLKGDDGEVQYAVFNPVQSYHNANGEKCFIVYLEIFQQNDGEITTGHPSRPKVELYLFKQLANGQYQLLSRTRPTLDIAGSWGESHLQVSDFADIRRVGKDQMGLTYSGGYTSTGSHTEADFLIVLNEQGWIEQYPFGVSESNIGAHDETDPEFGQYSKTYKILKNNQAEGLYPIQIEYSQRGKMDWVKNFPKNGTREVLQFNPKKNCYVHGNGQCNVDFDED